MTGGNRTRQFFEGFALPNPHHAPIRQKSFGAGALTTLTLGTMLAHVIIMTEERGKKVTLRGYGDEKMLASIGDRVEDGTLILEGEIPCKEGSGLPMPDGRETDLERAILLVLTVPERMNIAVTGVIGPVKLDGFLDSTLTFSPTIRAELCALASIRALNGAIGGHSSIVARVGAGNVDMTVSENASCDLSRASGTVSARISGQGFMAVRGQTSNELEISVSGDGRFDHFGSVRNDTRLWLGEGTGEILVLTALGKAVVAGDSRSRGKITVNRRTYRNR